MLFSWFNQQGSGEKNSQNDKSAKENSNQESMNQKNSKPTNQKNDNQTDVKVAEETKPEVTTSPNKRDGNSEATTKKEGNENKVEQDSTPKGIISFVHKQNETNPRWPVWKFVSDNITTPTFSAFQRLFFSNKQMAIDQGIILDINYDHFLKKLQEPGKGTLILSEMERFGLG